MAAWKQLVISAVILVGALLLWEHFFPGAAAFLDRIGVSVAAVETRKPDAAARGPRGGPPPTALGAAVTEATINDSVSAIGDGRAVQSVTVTPYVTGHVMTIRVAAGDHVASGTSLVELDADTERIALDRAQLVLADAQATQERDQRLVKSGAVTDVQLRADQLAASQAALAERDAALALQRRTISAPFDGWVGIVSVDVGDQVAPGTAIATLDDRSQILVDFDVPERLIGQLDIGATVQARPLARPGLTVEGKVSAIDSRISETTRTLKVRASFDNAADLLRPGMAFSVAMRFPGDRFPAVDPLAIQWKGDGAYVWVAADGKANQVPVQIVQRDNDRILVDASLAPGDMVVTEGVLMLRQGQPFLFANAASPTVADNAAPAAAVAPAAPRD